MRYVILRDDDTNALTPIDCLERLYRPFLDRGLPVNLAVIPDVSTAATTPEGEPEGFLTANWNQGDRGITASRTISPSPPRSGGEGRGEVEPVRDFESAVADNPRCASVTSLSDVQCSMFDVPKASTLPINSNSSLVQYLLANPDYHLLQHGCHHDYFEFDRSSTVEITARLDQGTRLLQDAGFPKPDTFVAPHDKFSPVAYREIAKRFPVISCGWFERRRLPTTWWPKYVAKKIRHAPHWRIWDTTLLSHPGCLLSWRRPYASMLGEITREIQSRRLTVLVTHWWEYFRDGKPDEPFIQCLHEVADYLTTAPDIRVVSFSDVAQGKIPLVA